MECAADNFVMKDTVGHHFCITFPVLSLDCTARAKVMQQYHAERVTDEKRMCVYEVDVS
jgi:hypothetical protein